MSRKNKAYRAFLHQNPSPTIEHAWDAAWANRQACFQSKRMQEQDDKITQLQAKNAALREAQRRIRELEAELSTLRESMRWIPVSERLPDEAEPVIVAGGCAYYQCGKWVSLMMGINEIQWSVTHWMPLPAPPQEQENGNADKKM